MAPIVLALASLFGPVTLPPVREAPEGQDVDVSVFYDSLAPYGEWIDLGDRGWAWCPADVAPDWRPYTRGHWEWSDDDGWLWVSDFPWGWAPFHYGRWDFDDDDGWLWFPGDVWGPAWVTWRDGDGVCGWAPLPPTARFEASIGLALGDEGVEAHIAPFWWSFVPRDHFTDRDVDKDLVLHARNVTLLATTRPAERVTSRNGRVFDEGVPLHEIEESVGHALRHVTVRDGDERAATAWDGDAVRMYRPHVSRAEPKMAPRPVPAAADRGVAEDLEREKQEQLEALQALHARQEELLRAEHDRELQHRPEGLSEESLRARQDLERHAQLEQHARERHVLERRFERRRGDHER